MDRIVHQVGVVVLAVLLLVAFWAVSAGWRRLLGRCPTESGAARTDPTADAWLQRLGWLLLIGILLVATALLPL